jgi:hypothetical protein
VRVLIWIVGILAVLWSGYWYAGSTVVQNGAQKWFADQNAAGMVAANSGLSVAGFPNRIDLTVTDMDFGDPVTGTRWRTPLVQVFAMTWKPWHIIAVLGDAQTLDLPGQSLAITTEDARASVVFRPNTDLGLSRISVSTTMLSLTSSRGWNTGADVVEFHTRLNPTANNAHDMALDATNLRPDAALMVGSTLPAAISQIRMNVTLGFSAPLDRHAGAAKPHVTSFAINRASMIWGDLTLDAQGTVATDANGLADGRIDIKITGWRKVIPVAVAAGLITPQFAPTLTGMLNAMATDAGDPETLRVPLVYANGRGTLGPLPLGPAPRLN